MLIKTAIDELKYSPTKFTRSKTHNITQIHAQTIE